MKSYERMRSQQGLNLSDWAESSNIRSSFSPGLSMVLPPSTSAERWSTSSSDHLLHPPSNNVEERQPVDRVAFLASSTIASQGPWVVPQSNTSNMSSIQRMDYPIQEPSRHLKLSPIPLCTSCEVNERTMPATSHRTVAHDLLSSTPLSLHTKIMPPSFRRSRKPLVAFKDKVDAAMVLSQSVSIPKAKIMNDARSLDEARLLRNTKLTLDERRKLKRRLDCRYNQRRCREKKREKEEDLEATIEEWKQRNKELYLLRNNLTTRLLALVHNQHNRIADWVTNYMSLFEAGLSMEEGPTRRRQVSYLESHSNPNMLFAFGRQVGVHHFIEQWERYVCLFESIKLRLKDVQFIVHGSNDPIAVVETIFTSRLTRRIVAALAPFLLDHEALLQRLLGRILHLPIRFSFYFDAQGKLCQLDPFVDYLMAFQDLLLDVEDVTRVMSGLSIHSNGDLALTSAAIALRKEEVDCVEDDDDDELEQLDDGLS